MEFKTHGAKPTVGTNPQKNACEGYELSKLPVASSLEAVRTLLTVKLPAHATSPLRDVLVCLKFMRSASLNWMWLAADVRLRAPPTDIVPEHNIVVHSNPELA